MRRRAALTVLTLAGLALLVAPAEARTVVVVLDRSGSLRYSDPDAVGPRQLAIALALALEPGDRLEVLATRGDSVPAREVSDAASLEGVLKDLLAEDLSGGADLLEIMQQAAQRAGTDGLVVLFTDDDLDLIGPGGAVPALVRERALLEHPRPARDELNRAALELLLDRWEQLGAPLVALRAPLPAQARVTPFLDAMDAEVVALGSGLESTAALVTAIRGDPLLAEARKITGSVTLPYAAKAVLTSETPISSPGATQLDRAGRVWLTESSDTLQVGAGEVTAWIAPQVALPDRVLGFELKQGGARLVLAGEDPGPGYLLARRGEQEAKLTGTPPQADLSASGPVTVLRVLDTQGAGRVVTDRRTIELTRAEIRLAVTGLAKVGETLTLRGEGPNGLPLPPRLALRIREGGGAFRQVELQAAAGALVGELAPRLPGALLVESQGELFVTVTTAVEIAAGIRHKLAISRVLGPDGQELTGPLEVAQPDIALQIELTVTPPLEAPATLELSLAGAPAEARLDLAGPVQIQDTVTVSATLHWPIARSAVVRLKAENDAGTLRTNRPLGIKGPPSMLRRGLAIGILCLSVLWFVWLLRGYRKRLAQQQALIGQKQLRGIGANGKISVERYFFRDFVQEDGPLDRLTLGPLGDGGDVNLEVELRMDGTVKVMAPKEIQLVHADRPELLGREVVLRHASAFATVLGQVARRYVYLEGEPTADDLQARFVEGTVSYEAELRDSGVFIVLDEDDNIPAGSDHDLTVSQELFVSHESLPKPEEDEETESNVTVVPSDHENIVSDEGILYMDSDEAEILDSDDQVFLSNSERVSREDQAPE